MTAEQLEELQRFVNRADNDEIDGFDGCDPYWAASLARRVIAAEELVEAIRGLDYMTNHIEAALAAYREASK